MKRVAKYRDNYGIVHFKQGPGRGRTHGERKYAVCEGPFGKSGVSIMYASWQLSNLPLGSTFSVTCIICLARRPHAV